MGEVEENMEVKDKSLMNPKKGKENLQKVKTIVRC